MILPLQVLGIKNHPRRQWTWKSPGDRSRNKIDYILIQKRFRNAIKASKSPPGVDCDSDQIPVMCLQLSLNRHASTATVQRVPCSSLTCEESSTNQTGGTITKMSVFKHQQSGAITFDKPGQGNLMASLTLEQLLTTRECDGVKIKGSLQAGRASLHLELFTEEDCNADYTCEVRLLEC
ncbi:craniofacial development protein 2-like [Plakobranchus ocellatus]|uniref:Craniofacial development protein 2-like n=1 Tax=Plakobranchus ocellatus TaxID=259542 RepID=A0AAV3ZF57_9GAST|nr:craniofacial development protein 2-like [Plakobranchus ocellatus]